MSIRSALLILLSAAVAGCAQKTGDGAAPPAAADKVATVNGKAISRNTFNYYVRGVTGKAAADLTDEQRGELLDNLIRGELVAQAAEKDGLAARDETRAVMELSRLTVLQQAATQNYLKDHKPTDAELQQEYQQQVTAMPHTEYRARHILVASEDAAKKVIAQLEKGSDFAQLARRESTDQGSHDKGGDLDWFTPDRMVKPFADAVATLKKGEFTHTPVQTSFGWHVIRLDDTREVAAPTFESVKERVAQIVDAKKFQAYTDGLMKSAKVEKSP
ncbi:MAG: peptidylprolyl isomerase [Steroidobacteraceae bacterium]